MQDGDQLSTFRGILDIENANQQTPFFVSIVKGFLGVSELLSAEGMSRIDTKDMVSTLLTHYARLGTALCTGQSCSAIRKL